MEVLAMTDGKGTANIYWVGGSRGGVGKSMMTVAMLDHLLERGSKVVLVECDTSNPDVGRRTGTTSRRSSSTSTRRTGGSTWSTRATGTRTRSW
jgi:Mrp family chromosome partitioning ATPase